MDSKIQTPDNRRTKYIIIAVAVLCVLSYLLYKENKVKKGLVTRKSFLIGKLYECRVASEKTETNFKEKRAQNAQLTKELSTKKDDYNQMAKKYDDLQGSYDIKAAELQQLKKSAEEMRNELSALKENYDSAMSSVKAMQGKLDDTIRVCEKHKQNSQSLNTSFAQGLRELETCKQAKASFDQEREVLVASEQDLRKKVQELGQTQNARRNVVVDAGGSRVQDSMIQPQLPILGKVQGTEYLHSQSTHNAAPSGQETAKSSQIPKTPIKEDIQVTPSLERPTAKQTVESDRRSRDFFKNVRPTIENGRLI